MRAFYRTIATRNIEPSQARDREPATAGFPIECEQGRPMRPMPRWWKRAKRKLIMSVHNGESVAQAEDQRGNQRSVSEPQAAAHRILSKGSLERASIIPRSISSSSIPGIMN